MLFPARLFFVVAVGMVRYVVVVLVVDNRTLLEFSRVPLASGVSTL